MNIDKFLKANIGESQEPNVDSTSHLLDSDVKQLITDWGGYSFEKGLFRIHTYHSSRKWTILIEESWPHLKGKISALGYDWLGRQYGKSISEECIYMLDISTGKSFVLDRSIEDFLNIELVDYREENLEKDDYVNWMKENSELKFNEIVGFQIPLCLGGVGDSTNYARIDSEVDWEINRQILSQL